MPLHREKPMLSIQFSEPGGPEVLKAVEIDMPAPGPNEVLIKTKCISVNYADTQIRRGVYPVMPPLPAIPGLEASGYIEKAGTGIDHLQPGQPVISFGQGCYAEYVVTPASTSHHINPETKAVHMIIKNLCTGLLHSHGVKRPYYEEEETIQLISISILKRYIYYIYTAEADITFVFLFHNQGRATAETTIG